MILKGMMEGGQGNKKETQQVPPARALNRVSLGQYVHPSLEREGSKCLSLARDCLAR